MAQKQIFKKRQRQGVPVGYKHDWNQRQRVREKKIGPKTYIVHEKGYKKSRFSKRKSGPKVGTSFDWHWNRKQRTTKIDKDTYKVEAVSTKKLIKVNKPSKRRSHY